MSPRLKTDGQLKIEDDFEQLRALRHLPSGSEDVDFASSLTEMLLNQSGKKDEKSASYAKAKQYDPSLGKLMNLI